MKPTARPETPPANLHRQKPAGMVMRYLLAVVTVAVAMGLRIALEEWVGNGLPPFITFYPAMMAVVVLTGFGPGVLATVLMALIAYYWILPPIGEFAVASPVARLGLAIFTGTNLFVCVIAELYRRSREKAAAYERETALHDSRARLAAFAEATFEGIAESEAGRIVDCNEQLARMLGYAVSELKGMPIADLIAPEDLGRVAANISQGEESTIEHAMLRKDGTRIIVEAHGRPFAPDSAVRHTAVRDITGRKQAEQTLQKAHDELAIRMEERTRELREKEVLLKEIHHRVKNNLQVISSLVGLQAEGSGDESVREVLRDVTYRVRSMALVHEKLYQSTNLASIDFAEYVRSLLNYLWRAHGSAAAAVRLTFDLEPLSLPVDTAVPCGLILNELAGNALKHAFRGRDAGEVTVSLRGTPDGRISLCLRDDGVGLPAGLDWRQARSLGLRLVQMLAGQLNATVELNHHGGTEFRIIFNLPETAKDGEPEHE